jgi:RNA polymerase sigma factor (sigma-70 family)
MARNCCPTDSPRRSTHPQLFPFDLSQKPRRSAYMDIDIDSPDRMSLDADGVARLYTAHAEAMLGFFMRRTFQPEVSMDLVAETFACAFRDRGRCRGSEESEQVAWLYGIARHRLIDFARRGRVERAALERFGFHRRALTDGEYERVEELAGLEEMRKWLAAGLDGLGREHREALQLRVIEERSYADLAAMLDVSEQTARARVSRALRAMRGSAALSGLVEGDEHA